MIDFGLLMSIIVAVVAPTLLQRWWTVRTLRDGATAIDALVVPAGAGVIVGRLTTLAIDDPRSIGSVSDMLVIRSGVEFWPAVAVVGLLVAWSGRRDRVNPLTRVADLAPFAMVGYGAYEVACLFRDGCYGPASALGIKPDGLTTSMVPVGVLMGLGAVAGAAAIRRVNETGWPPGAVAAAAVALVATVRSLGSIWLPKVGDAMTRQHRTSIAVLILAATACTAELALARSRPERVAA